MKLIKTIFLALLLSSTVAIAAPASEGSIKQLLAVTEAQKLLEGIRAQTEALIDKTIQQALRGGTPSDQQQQALANMKAKMLVVLHESIQWERMEAMSVRLYKEVFSEEEVVGMLDFYKAPAGQALVRKMPGLVQRTMLEMQLMSAEMTPKLQKIQEQYALELGSSSR